MIAEDISFCLGLIGKPWVSGACGPDAFDCWGLLRHVLAARRGITLCPHAGVDESGLAGMLRTAEDECAAHWERIDQPAHLCGVAMGRGRRIEHVGIWLEEGGGGILHSYCGGGVVFERQANIRARGFQTFIFYNFKS